MATLIDAVRRATVAAPADVESPPARFALVLRQAQDSAVVRAAAEGVLTPLGARVAPLSRLEPRILVAELPRRIFGADDSASFTAAYLLREHFDLAAAEPDIPTNFFPEATSRGDGKEPADESVDDFPPGCWVPRQPELDQNPMWSLKAMRVPEAWDFSTARQRPSQGSGVIVAQPDTGVTAHAELDGVHRVPGFDVLTGRPDPTDPLDDTGNPGHGTGTASVVVSSPAGVVTGSAPLARHMAIRAIRNVVRISQVSVAEAIDWAVENGAQIITMSLGGIFSFSLHRALRRAVEADVIVLAAAGNCVRQVVWPARYDECLAVGGTNSADRQWPGSCRGSAVDFSAPAQNVLRAAVPRGALPGGSAVSQGQGTSFAVALTAGVAALWLAHHGRANVVAAARARGETVQTMFRRLVRATARRGPNWDPFEMGAGVVDARALLEADFDLARELETVEPPPDAPARAAVTVESLVAETLGAAAVPDDDAVDWYQFGPEISTALLRWRFAEAERDRPAGPGQPEAPPTPPPTVSGHLARSVHDPRLRGWLGLDPPRGTEADRATPGLEGGPS